MNIQTTKSRFIAWATSQPDTECRRWAYEIEALNMGAISYRLQEAGFNTSCDGSVSEQDCECDCSDCTHECNCDYCDRSDYDREHCSECGTNEISPSDHLPALTTKDGARLETARTLFERASVYVDDSCGGHIHVDAKDLTPRHGANVVRLWRKVETLFPEIIGRDHSEFAHDMSDEDIEALSNGNHGMLDRYKAVNFRNIAYLWDGGTYSGKTTIEFRKFAGTANLDLIIARGYLCRAIIEHAKGNGSLYWLLRSQTAEQLLIELGLGLKS